MGSPTFGGTPEYRVKFYLNDGAPFNGYATPGTTFFDSGWYALPGTTPRSTISFSTGLGDFGGVGLYMPVVSNMTWSVDFRNLGVNDQVGLDIYDPPTIGSSYPDYWEYNAGWSLKTNASVNVNFASVFIATVPEPTVIGFFTLGGMLLAGGIISRRK